MDPISIAVICVVSFGAVAALSAFIKQLLVSRDIQRNSHAQHRALKKEVGELEKLRQEMESNHRYDSHYKILGENKDAIIYLDDKIEDLFKKKSRLIERYSQLTLKESETIIDHGILQQRKEACDALKKEIDKQLIAYDKELDTLQQRRASLWDSHIQLQTNLIGEEKARNGQLDDIYQKHTGIFEKIFLRHMDQSTQTVSQGIEASNLSFKLFITSPFEFLKTLFSPSTGISADQMKNETAARERVKEAESEINGPDEEADNTNGGIHVGKLMENAI